MRRTVPQLKRFKTVNIIFKAEHEIKSPNFALYERENSTANESHFYFIHGSAFTFLTERSSALREGNNIGLLAQF